MKREANNGVFSVGVAPFHYTAVSSCKQSIENRAKKWKEIIFLSKRTLKFCTILIDPFVVLNANFRGNGGKFPSPIWIHTEKETIPKGRSVFQK